MTPVPSEAAYGVLACALAVLIAVLLVLVPGPVRLPAGRRRPPAASTDGPVDRAIERATAMVAVLLRRGRRESDAAVLELAGVRLPLADFVLRVGGLAVLVGGFGFLLVGLTTGLLLGLVVLVGARVAVDLRAARRRTAFADQLEDTLQLVANGLRAGHSLTHALEAVAREADEPTASEFARAINQTRVGRPLGVSLAETADRMQSADFTWVTEAMAINAETGGNLAEVLESVADTIRERNQIRRQVKALSAEGTLSAYVLVALPFGIAGFLLFANPAYMMKFTESLLGFVLIGVSVVLLVIGGLWLRKVVRVKF